MNLVKLSLSLPILNALDLITTYIGLTYLNLRELNPFSGPLQLIYKLAFMFTLIILAFKMNRSMNKPLRIGFTTVLLTYIIIYIITVTNNLLLIWSVM